MWFDRLISFCFANLLRSGQAATQENIQILKTNDYWF